VERDGVGRLHSRADDGAVFSIVRGAVLLVLGARFVRVVAVLSTLAVRVVAAVADVVARDDALVVGLAGVRSRRRARFLAARREQQRAEQDQTDQRAHGGRILGE